MKNKLKLGQAAGVVAFAIIIGAVSMSSSSTVDARTSLKENRTVNAGVALGLTEAAAGNAGAQDLKSVLSGVLKSVVGDKTTTESSIIGTWTYVGPECRFESDNLLAKAGGEVAAKEVEEKIQAVYEKVGMDGCQYTFSEDGSYSCTIKGKTSSGTYTFDSDAKTVTMKGKLGIKIVAYVTVTGESMSFVFKADKLMSVLKTVASTASRVNSTASTINSIADSYDGIKGGLRTEEVMNLYELFINMYLQEVRQLVKRGIKLNYVEQEDNLRYYKGKLLVSENVRLNLAHKERFYVSYEEFHPNRAENRLVKATLAKLQRLTTSAENSKEIRQLLTAFEMVDASVNYTKDFSQVVINRNTKEYEVLMQWSKVFLMNKSFTTFSGSTISRALLFPMESIYESYVAQQMKKVMSPEGWTVSCQDRGHYLFIEPRRQFALRPDIVIKKGERIVILDTKWKSLVNNEKINYGISQADMYQMYAYSKKYDTSEIWLLYPVNDEMRNHKSIRFESGDGTTVNLYFVDVDKIEDSLRELVCKLEVEK